MPATATAQTASDADKIRNLERQTELLQAQLKELKGEISRMRTAPAVLAAPAPAPSGYVKAPPPPPPPAPKVKVTVGGFIAAESVWRQRNDRQRRTSPLVQGNLDPWQKLTGYYESDFLGAGTASNYNQSNSWPLRL